MAEASYGSSREFYASEEYAKRQDAGDPLRHLRNQFIIPSRADLKRKRLDGEEKGEQFLES